MSNDKVKELLLCLSIGTVFKLNGYLIAKSINSNELYVYRDCIKHKIVDIDELLDNNNNLIIIGCNKTEFTVL